MPTAIKTPKPKKTERTPLVTLRGLRHFKQAQLADASGLFQGDISKLERRDTLDDVTVSTLRRYVEGLGGKLKLVAEFPTEPTVNDHVLRGFTEADKA